jgi:hypothetical protein
MSDSSTLFALLADDYRRLILILLCQEDTIVVPDDLEARGQICRTRSSHSTEITIEKGQPDRMEAELYHVHLPRLASEGVIRWDRESGAVSKGPAFVEYESALRVIVDSAEQFPLDLL